MVPLYGIASLVSLYSKLGFIDSIRDIYESFVIYSFFVLLINYLGGERELMTEFESRSGINHFWPLNLVLDPLHISDPGTFLLVRKGITQFVVVKPLLAILVLVLKLTGHYEEGYIAWNNSYIYITLLYNVSVVIAMYFLVIFYMLCAEDLKPFRPFPKFLCVKAIIFLTFWQGILLAMLVWAKIINDEKDYSANNTSIYLQDMILCFEMPLFAWMHHHSFPWTDYFDNKQLSSRLKFGHALRDALGVKDIFRDTLLLLTYSVPQTRNENVDIWAEEDEETPLVTITTSNLEYTIPLKFEDPDELEEQDYDIAKRLEFGDYNYPVIHEEQHHPPTVQREIEQQARNFESVKNSRTSRYSEFSHKRFETKQEIEDRLLQAQNSSRSDNRSN